MPDKLLAALQKRMRVLHYTVLSLVVMVIVLMVTAVIVISHLQTDLDRRSTEHERIIKLLEGR